MTPAEYIKLQADVLLAGYRDKKSEIARRSTLSWTATAGYLVFLYNAASVISKKENPSPFAWPLAVWIVSLTAYLFVYSQFQMIMALSDYILKHIEPSLRQLSRSSGPLLGERGEEFSRIQVFLDRARALFLLVFVVAPAVLNGYAIYQGGPCPELAYLIRRRKYWDNILSSGTQNVPSLNGNSASSALLNCRRKVERSPKLAK